MSTLSDTSLEQDSFLNSIASKLGRPRRSGVKPPVWEQKLHQQLHQEFDQEALIEQFIATLASLNTEVDRVRKADFGRALDHLIAKFAVKSAMLWDDQRLHDLDTSNLLTAKQVENRVWQTNEEEQEQRSFAARVDMGVTFAEMGLAETGTVVLFNGGGRGRLVSLLPPVYVVVLQEKRIFPRLTQGVSEVHQHVSQGLPACINFISGPSRTGDIEMDLAFGVHGPGKVHVILLQD